MGYARVTQMNGEIIARNQKNFCHIVSIKFLSPKKIPKKSFKRASRDPRELPSSSRAAQNIQIMCLEHAHRPIVGNIFEFIHLLDSAKKGTKKRNTREERR